MIRKIKYVLLEMRVKQYLKNIMVFLPLIFSLNLFNQPLLLSCVLMFLSFCLGSSAVYILNDIADKEKDLRHPRKKFRPIASGKISFREGIIIMAACLIISVCISLYISLNCFYAILFFIAVNIAYSFYLKNIPLLDVLCIASGFVARVAAGSMATGINISDWLLLSIMSLSLFLGFGKRKSEINLDLETRHVLQFYTKDFLSQCMHSMMSVSIVFYSLWSIDENTTYAMQTNKLIYTTAIVIIGLLRYSLVTEKSGEGDPTEVILKDRALHIIVGIYAVFVMLLIYL